MTVPKIVVCDRFLPYIIKYGPAKRSETVKARKISEDFAILV